MLFSQYVTFFFGLKATKSLFSQKVDVHETTYFSVNFITVQARQYLKSS